MGQRFRVGDSTFEDVQAYLFQMINGLRNALTAQTRVFTGHSLRTPQGAGGASLSWDQWTLPGETYLGAFGWAGPGRDLLARIEGELARGNGVRTFTFDSDGEFTFSQALEPFDGDASLSLGTRFREALEYAVRLHDGQTRTGTTIPYAAHLLAVSALVLEDGGDEDQAIAGLLHDAVEDQGGPLVLEEIRRKFGDGVAALVEGCTDSSGAPKPPWRERKERYVERVREGSPELVRVSLSDKLHNARAILRDFKCFGPGVWSRFSASREEVLWYYRSLVSAYRSTGAGAMVDELDLVVSEIALRCGDVPKKTNGRPVVEGPVSAGDTLRLGTMYFAIVAAPPVIDPGAA